MKGKIAVEPALATFKEYLAGQGYEVENMNPNSSTNLNAYDAIVVTGLNRNLLDMHDTETKAVVISADGLTPQEVAKRIDEIQ